MNQQLVNGSLGRRRCVCVCVSDLRSAVRSGLTKATENWSIVEEATKSERNTQADRRFVCVCVLTANSCCAVLEVNNRLISYGTICGECT